MQLHWITCWIQFTDFFAATQDCPNYDRDFSASAELFTMTSFARQLLHTKPVCCFFSLIQTNREHTKAEQTNVVCRNIVHTFKSVFLSA